MKRILIVGSAALLSGCGPTLNSSWIETVEGNDIEVKSGTQNSSRVIFVENKLRSWNGRYQGGESMVPERKKLFTQLAKAEAERVCKPHGFVMIDSPSYTMTERNADTFGGGLIGYAIANAMAEYENLPVAGEYNFKCTNEK